MTPPAFSKVVEIIRAASRESDIVVVVSAMSGVTNKLIEAATQSEAGNRDAVADDFRGAAQAARRAASALIDSLLSGTSSAKIQELFQEGERLCRARCCFAN